MSTRKFRVGDRARPRVVQPCYWWLNRSRPLKVVAVIPATHGGHCYYTFAARRGRPAPEIRSDRLRTHEERLRAPGGGRRAAK